MIAALVSDQLLYHHLILNLKTFLYEHVHSCNEFLICWLIDICGFLLYDYLIFSLHPCSFHARLPACLEYVQAFPTVYGYLNSGYDQFSVAHPAGLIIDTRNWRTVYRNKALSAREGEQRDQVKVKDVWRDQLKKWQCQERLERGDEGEWNDTERAMTWDETVKWESWKKISVKTPILG